MQVKDDTVYSISWYTIVQVNFRTVDVLNSAIICRHNFLQVVLYLYSRVILPCDVNNCHLKLQHRDDLLQCVFPDCLFRWAVFFFFST